jgi:List-Bact-rpt repeat protein
MSSRRILARGVFAILAAAAACLNDAPSGPSAGSGRVGLQIRARVEAAQEDRTVTIRVFYRQQNEDEIDLPSTPTSVRIASGTTKQQPVTVTVTRCLEDPERERDEGGSAGCLLYVELQLLGVDGVLLSAQTQGAGAPEPGATVEVPEFDLPQAAIDLSETTVSFAAEELTTVPAAKAIGISSVTGAPLGEISVAIAAESNWLKATLGDGQFTLQPTTTNLAAGPHTATVTVNSSRAGIASKSLSVTYTIVGRPQTLTIGGAGSGDGRVTSEPAGITCTITAGTPTGACSAQFGLNSTVRLTAAATNGSFTEWSGACTGTESCQVTMGGARSVTARFTAPAQRLLVTLAGNGSGTVTSNPAGISCAVTELGDGGVTCGELFPFGTQVTLTATPINGSTFSGWSGACAGSGPCTVTVDQARSVTATLSAPGRTVSVTGAGSGSGSVTSEPSGIDCTITAGTASGACSASFGYGAQVTLTATASNGSFTGWSGACTGTGSCQVTTSESRSVTAEFTAPLQSLTAVLTGSGAGGVTSDPSGISCAVSELGSDGTSCSAQFAYGAQVTLTATPSGGSTFAGWSGACSGAGTCTVVMDQARSATATFTAPPQNLGVIISGPAGRVVSDPKGIDCEVGGEVPSSACDAQFPFGARVVLTPQSVDGTEFVGWEGACVGRGECAVTMDQERSVTANFRHPPQRLTVEGAGTGGGRVTSSPAGINCTIGSGKTEGVCTFDFAFDTQVTLTAAATEEGGSFAGWSGDCEGTGTCEVSMNQPRTETASFRGPPPPGGDVVVYNDMNVFDDGAMVTSSNQTMVRNIVTFTTTRARADAKVVWIDRGRDSNCFADGECAERSHVTMTRVMTEAGFVVTGILSSSGFYAEPIPASVKVLWLFMPDVSFTRAEINNLKTFAAEGGRIVFLGEHLGFYGQSGIDLENQFMKDMGAVMTNKGNTLDCGYNTLPQSSLREHQITQGMTEVRMACSSEIILGPEDFALYYDSSNSHVLSGVARIDTTPLPAVAAKSSSRPLTATPSLNRQAAPRSASGVVPD